MTKTKIREFMRQYVSEAVCGCEIPLDISESVVSILQYHPRWSIKTTGATHLVIHWKKDKGHNTNRCFYVVYADGTKDDISWVKALSAMPSWAVKDFQWT